MSVDQRIRSGAAVAASDIRRPHGHYDEEGGASAQARVDSALRSFVLDVGAVAALRLDACVHCGMCAEACPFYVNTGDPRYTPIHKAEPLKQAYKREVGPFAPLFKVFGLKRRVTISELREWEELLFDSCTLCGRCSLICPMGIDITALIQDARHGMAEAGLVPKPIYDKALAQHRTGDSLGKRPEEMVRALAEIARAHQVEIPVDRPESDVMVCTTADELTAYPDTVAAMAKILAHTASKYTFCSQAIDGSNYGYVEGSLAWERESVLRLVDVARQCGARTLIMPEDAYAYVALRWEGTELFGEPLPFEVKHISEFMVEELDAGRLHLDRRGGGAPVFIHESCHLIRRGGTDIGGPIKLLEAMGLEAQRPADRGAFSWCCGGGGGVLENKRAEPLRYRVFEAKMREVESTGAEDVVTCCSVCRRTFDDGMGRFDWDKSVKGLTELVADHLASPGAIDAGPPA